MTFINLNTNMRIVDWIVQGMNLQGLVCRKKNKGESLWKPIFIQIHHYTELFYL